MSSRTLRVLSAVVGVPLLLGGAGAGVAAGLQAAEGGSFATPEHRFTSPTAAIKTDEIAVGAEAAHAGDPDPDIGEAAEVTITARAADPATPIFVGIGPKAQVERYLRGTAHEDFTSARLDPLRASFRRSPGAEATSPPRAQTFWVATESGTGTRRLAWDKSKGAWSAVTMRLDGRPGVDVHASIGLRFGFLTPVAVAATAGAALLIGYAVPAGRRRHETED